MGRHKDLTGQIFGRLTVLKRVGTKARHVMWLCECQCGSLKVAEKNNLVKGDIKSCGCLKSELLEAIKKKPKKPQATRKPKPTRGTYNCYRDMKKRCNNPSSPDWPDYGGRGISIAPEWNTFKAFLADMGERPNGYSIERKDVNGNYCKENCEWIPVTMQARNKRNTVWITAYGETRPLAEWCEMNGVTGSQVRYRLSQGWEPERAVSRRG